jgi:hypothetical protein
MATVVRLPHRSKDSGISVSVMPNLKRHAMQGF